MSFLRSVFSESDGTGSASRILMAFHAIAGAAFIGHHLYHGHPLGEVPWSGITTFVATPYGLNQVKSAIAAFSNKPGS